jgi:xanthosine utilization system XapX-like protein
MELATLVGLAGLVIGIEAIKQRPRLRRAPVTVSRKRRA